LGGANVLDYQQGLARLDNDLNFYKEVLTTFLNDVPPRMQRLEQAIHNQDAAAVTLEAHTIKGSAENIGAVALGAAAKQLEIKGKDQQLDTAVDLLAALRKEFDMLAQLVEKLDSILQPPPV
jgi:HPt (histidine-containing phosphotransfer) domain-containing protein